MDFRLEFDAGALQRFFRDIERQIPFAMSLALNQTAADVQERLRAELDRHFTIRSPWTAKGIQVQRSTKRDLRAVIGSRDEYMARQALGGVKTAQGGKLVGIPVGVRKRRSDKTPRSKWPGAMAKRKNVYIAETSGGPAMFRKVGRGNKARTELLYLLRPEVKVEPEWPFLDTVEQVVEEKWASNAEKALARALKTAK